MFNSWRVFLQTTCAVALIAAASLVSAQDFKIGVVNPERCCANPRRRARRFKSSRRILERQKEVEDTARGLKARRSASKRILRS